MPSPSPVRTACGGRVVPHAAPVSAASSVSHASVAAPSVTSSARTFAITGAAQSTAAVSRRTTFVPPAPSFASTYSTVSVSPFAVETTPSPCAGGTPDVATEPEKLPAPGLISASVTISGSGSVSEDTLTVSVEPPVLPSSTRRPSVAPHVAASRSNPTVPAGAGVVAATQSDTGLSQAVFDP